MVNYSYEQQSFVIEGFDQAKPFSSFLPGMAGLKGIPMWTFYVNRGQAVCSFGIRDKNSSIMEFSPASITYKSIATNGFRTFIKIRGVETVYEPFQTSCPDSAAKRVMRIRPNELTIEEQNAIQGLETRVTYFNLPHEDYAALVRQVEVKNVSQQALELEILDGMPEILPYGVENGGFKEVGNLLRSWMEVYNLEQGIPFYKVRSSTHDEAEVTEVANGHFYLSFSEDGQPITPIVDFEIIFGSNTSLAYPERFADTTLSDLVQQPQYPYNKVPCGFTGTARTLQPGQSLHIYTLIGHVNDIEKINRRAASICSDQYVLRKRQEANDLTEQLTEDIATHTSSPMFDAYSRQSYMDNFLRGGYPFLFDNGKDGFVIHLYSRKHGDLERDYNFFSLAPEYYSQGNGNFRDMNQNRRNDVFFNPQVGTFNIWMFFSLMQADGYNPLGVAGCTFQVPKVNAGKLAEWIKTAAADKHEPLLAICSGKFTPGQIINYVADHAVPLQMSEEQFLTGLFALAEQQIEAEFGEGFWTDHWTYNMDLVDGYLEIFPDKKEELLFGEDTYAFYDSPVYVLPRSEKYVLSGDKVRQYGALIRDEEKMEQLGRKVKETHWLRTRNGRGEIYRTNLFVKMLSLSLNKFTCLDPYGMGVEMEANKPGWNDAMNGLPGLFGSGMSETFELKRLVQFMLNALDEYSSRTIRVPEEMAELLHEVHQAIKEYAEGRMEQFVYWDRVASLRESYRERIRFGISGIEAEVSLDVVQAAYRKFIAKIDEGIEQAIEFGTGLTPTYFRFEAEAYEAITDEQGHAVMSGYGLPKAKVNGFKAYALPYFLEGPTRWLNTIDDPTQAKHIYDRIRSTDLFDPTTHMYKTSVSLEQESHEIGRMRAFTPGWLERESNFLHMSYKYLLALLKAGLYEEYTNELKTSLVPFLDPAVYGRSTLENSSFIATGVNPDPHVHGRGFVARLSGSTAEFISMWRYMMVGKRLFRMHNGELELTFCPILPGWLFDDSGQVSFKFLGSVQVTYHNPRRADTFGEAAAVVRSLTVTLNNGQVIEVDAGTLHGSVAEAIRSGEAASIDVYLT
ncbi:hypothetical protein [Paenibacillus sp. OSY-SE]|uniref:hypothetical protein n=1 Tax=Paenibacillus sp. OSY-SE TaxID=1196323 RepID=UPI0002E78409|nr:hypothetical protein [Paenibacillus sp. OSY-SE]